VLVIGEKINSSLSGVAEAIAVRDEAFIQALAQCQAQAGAQLLEVNAASSPGDEPDNLEWLARTVQGAVDLPLCLDSASTPAIEAALSSHRGKAIVNSITGEPGRAEGILPLVKKHGCQVVGLAVGPEGVPHSAPERMENARLLTETVRGYGIPLEDLYLDPGVLPVSVAAEAGVAVLQTLRDIRSTLGVKTIMGVSNISFGLPRRRLLNRTFLAAALALGLDAAILDPLDRELMATAAAARALLGEDEYCAAYLAAFRQGLLDAPAQGADSGPG
jgi:5-methyltetrahydrofolate--homocysteine methyltransferase